MNNHIELGMQGIKNIFMSFRFDEGVSRKFSSDEDVLILCFGSKKIFFYLDIDKKLAMTILENDKSIDKKNNETTILYRQIKQLCEKLVQIFGEFNYILVTSDETMKLWALSKGNDVFDWDTEKIELRDDDGVPVEVLTCKKHFKRVR